MRSSKNRSRSKGNRNRSVGNVVNRVFDSSGPEGKVRGTPQQIIDKYNQLTRDAQLGGDRVAAENFQQHAEHYLRMLAEAQREMEARREQQQQNNQNYQNNQQQDRGAQGNAQQQPRPDPQAQPAPVAPGMEPAMGEAGGETGLVETPENAAKPKRSRNRRPRRADEGQPTATAESGEAAAPQGDDSPDTPPQEAAE